MYWLKNKVNKLNLYGVSSKNLTDYVTSEKDVIRHINRMPSSYFLMNQKQRDSGSEKSMEELDFEDLDEFVLVEREELQ